MKMMMMMNITINKNYAHQKVMKERKIFRARTQGGGKVANISLSGWRRPELQRPSHLVRKKRALYTCATTLSEVFGQKRGKCTLARMCH